MSRLQNSPYFCVFKYARAVKQKVWNEAENRERDWGETLRACEARELRARKTHTPRFTDFFTDFEKKTRLFCSLGSDGSTNDPINRLSLKGAYNSDYEESLIFLREIRPREIRDVA